MATVMAAGPLNPTWLLPTPKSVAVALTQASRSQNASHRRGEM